jgi:hypothetical protein
VFWIRIKLSSWIWVRISIWTLGDPDPPKPHAVLKNSGTSKDIYLRGFGSGTLIGSALDPHVLLRIRIQLKVSIQIWIRG